MKNSKMFFIFSPLEGWLCALSHGWGAHISTISLLCHNHTKFIPFDPEKTKGSYCVTRDGNPLRALTHQCTTLSLEGPHGEGTSTDIARTPMTQAGLTRNSHTSTQEYLLSPFNEPTSRTRRQNIKTFPIKSKLHSQIRTKTFCNNSLKKTAYTTNPSQPHIWINPHTLTSPNFQPCLKF
jgi:hypothetical protein